MICCMLIIMSEQGTEGEKTSLERQTDTIIYSCFFKIYPLRYQTNKKVSFAFSRPLWLPHEGHMS